MVAIWILLAFVAAALLLTMPGLRAADIYARRRGARLVTCPDNHAPAAVEMDALYAATTGVAGNERLRLASCSRWPEMAGCPQECLSQLAEKPQEAAVLTGPARVYPPAVLAAAGVYCLLAAVWYAEPVFGGAWMAAHGFTQQMARDRAELLAPYLLAVLGAVLLSYVLSWVLVHTGRATAARGVAVGALLWVGVLGPGMLAGTLFEQRPLVLFWIHGGYTLVGTLLMGAILGGWHGALSPKR